MKREIDGYVYDTSDARVIASYEKGTTHLRRLSSLYRSGEGRYFIVEEQEAYGVDGAQLTPLTEARAQEWLEHHGKADLASSLFNKGRIFLRIEIDKDMLWRVDAAAEAAGQSEQAWVIGAINDALANAAPPLASASPDGGRQQDREEA